MTTHFQHMHITAKTIRLLGMILIVLLFSSLTVMQAQAAPLRQTGCTLPATVTTADQLYDCITAANTNGAGLDTITLGADIDLADLTTSPLPNIGSTIVLQGAGYAIDGGWDGVDGSTVGVGIFNVEKDGNLTVNQATLHHGNGIPGGGIYNRGSLTITNSTFRNNLGTVGGAIANAHDNFTALGTATVTSSTFADNDGGVQGGAIHNDGAGGTVTVTNSTFSGNVADHGGAIYVSRGQVTATNNTFSGNSATVLGDATYSTGAGWRLYLAGNIFAGHCLRGDIKSPTVTTG